MYHSLHIHRASRLVPVNSPILSDGAVVVDRDHIVAAGPFAEITKQFPGVFITDHQDAVLMPGLINAHIHLELSHLGRLSQNQPPESFTGWITGLLAARKELGATGKTVETAAAAMLEAQYRGGVIAIADIGNTSTGKALGNNTTLKLFHFLEYLGLSRAGLMPARA
ncbi:MAG: amidohydrolase family protein, partial [Desulfobulbaceae bacterium]|nr:amidohydrolase family protein [Desulfobulbaceae bacterium]